MSLPYRSMPNGQMHGQMTGQMMPQQTGMQFQSPSGNPSQFQQFQQQQQQQPMPSQATGYYLSPNGPPPQLQGTGGSLIPSASARITSNQQSLAPGLPPPSNMPSATGYSMTPPAPGPMQNMATGMSRLASQPTGIPGQWGFVNTPITGLPGIEALQARLMPQTGTSGPQGAGPLQGNAKIPWAVTKDEKGIYDKIFDAWDGLGKGFLSGETCVDLLGQSGLQREDLEKVWTLSDPGNRGRLNKDEFAVAMHLVYRKLNNYPLPNRLPPELVPPSSRNISDSISQVKSYLRTDAENRRSNGSTLLPQQTGVSYLKARSFRTGSAQFKKDATVFKNNDDEAGVYVSNARHRSANRDSSRASSTSSSTSRSKPSKVETLEDLRKAVREKQILLDAVDVEDEEMFEKDSFLERRDRDEADDLLRKIRRVQEELDSDPRSAIRSVDDGAERRELRRQLQYMLDRLPTLISSVRSTCNKLADAKVELFALRDAKAHPGQRLLGTGPGGIVTESDRRKAKSLAILQARMAALTGKPAPVTAGEDEEQAAEARQAEESDRVRVEKETSERMIIEVDEGVNQLRDSLEQMLRDDEVDVKKDREWRRWEEGVGVEDEVRDFIYELQRKSRLAASTYKESRYDER